MIKEYSFWLGQLRFRRAVKRANKALYQQARVIRKERKKYAHLSPNESMRKSALLRGELSRVVEAIGKQIDQRGAA